MPLTRAFKETVQARIRQDRKYRKELLREGVDYINGTIGFEKWKEGGPAGPGAWGPGDGRLRDPEVLRRYGA